MLLLQGVTKEILVSDHIDPHFWPVQSTKKRQVYCFVANKAKENRQKN